MTAQWFEEFMQELVRDDPEALVPTNRRWYRDETIAMTYEHTDGTMATIAEAWGVSVSTVRRAIKSRGITAKVYPAIPAEWKAAMRKYDANRKALGLPRKALLP